MDVANGSVRRVRAGYGWALWLTAGLLAASGCGSDGPGTGPGSSNCSVTVTRTALSVAATSGTGRVGVSSRGQCSWTGVSSASWLTIAADAGGSGSGGLAFAFEANPTLAPRTATITINGEVVTVTQEAPTLAGTWVSSGTDALRTVAFTLRDRVITRVRLTYLFPISGGRTCDRTYTQDLAVPLTEGRFRVDFQSGGVSTTLVVGFASSLTAEGVVERQTFANASCGAGPAFSGSFGGFEAVFRPE